MYDTLHTPPLNELFWRLKFYGSANLMCHAIPSRHSKTAAEAQSRPHFSALSMLQHECRKRETYQCDALLFCVSGECINSSMVIKMCFVVGAWKSPTLSSLSPHWDRQQSLPYIHHMLGSLCCQHLDPIHPVASCLS